MRQMMSVSVNTIKKRLDEIELRRAPILPPPTIGISLTDAEGNTTTLVDGDGRPQNGVFEGLPNHIEYIVIKPAPEAEDTTLEPRSRPKVKPTEPAPKEPELTPQEQRLAAIRKAQDEGD